MSTTLSPNTSSSSCHLADVPTPPSPLSETSSSRLPQSPSTGVIWAELATLTVAAFTEPVIARLRAFVDQTPQFDKSHLQMLGPIVVRHVALMLEDMPAVPPPAPVCHCRCERRRPRSARVIPSSPHSQEENIRPTTPPSSGPPRRPSLRDIAYQAVRLNKILPESFSAQPHPDVPSKIVRKLSITTRTPEPGRKPFLSPNHSQPASDEPSAPPPLILHSHSRLNIYKLDDYRPQSLSRVEKEPLPHTSDKFSKDFSAGLACTESHCSTNPTSKSRDPGSDSDDRSASYSDLNVSTRWQLQHGRPDPSSSMPRAGLHTNLESYSARTLKSRPRLEPRQDSDPPSSHDTSPQGHVPVPSHRTTKDKTSVYPSRLVLLRRQRERRRSSLR